MWVNRVSKISGVSGVNKVGLITAAIFSFLLFAGGEVKAQGGGVILCQPSGLTPVPCMSDSAGRLAVNPQPTTYFALNNSVAGTTAATTATLNSTASTTVFICGFNIDAVATAAVVVTGTVNGIQGGTMTFQHFVAVAGTGGGSKQVTFTPCNPAVAVSTPITVVSGAPGVGGVINVTAWGYRQ